MFHERHLDIERRKSMRDGDEAEERHEVSDMDLFKLMNINPRERN